MPRVTPVQRRDYSSEFQIVFKQHETIYNSPINNLKATLAHSPVAFKVYMQWYPIFEELKLILGNRLATLFAWTISEASGSPATSAYFRKTIIDSGENPEELVLTNEERQLLAFGAAIADNKGKVADDLYEAIHPHYTDEHIVVFSAFAGITIATSFFNNVIETEIDEILTSYVAQIENA
jgi:hypothetical protein